MKRKKSHSNEIIEYILTSITVVNILLIAKSLGLHGIGYFAISMTFIYLVISFVSGWAGSFLTRYIKGRSTRKQYRNASNFFRGSLLAIGISSLVVTVVLVLFNNYVGKLLFKDIHIGLCICIAAPIVFLYSISVVFSGYFKGLGINRPVLIYQIIRCFVTFTGSFYFMKITMNYGAKVSALLQNQEITYIYGAFGAIAGFVIGQFIGFITLFVFWILFHGEISRLIHSDTTRYSESILDCIRMISINGVVSGAKNVLFLCAPMINYILYLSFNKTTDGSFGIALGGCLFGIALPCMLFVIHLFMLWTQKSYKGMNTLIKNEDYTQIRNKHFNMILGLCTFGLFIAVSFAVLAPILIHGLSISLTESQNTFVSCFIACSVLVIGEIIHIRLNTLMNNKVFIYLASLLGFVIQTACFILGYKMLNMGIYSILFGTVVNTIVLNLLCIFRLGKRIRLGSASIRRLIMGLIVAFAGALVVLLIYQLFVKSINGIVLFLICFLPGFILYLLGMVFLQIIDYDEADQIPFGPVILQVARLLHRE
ncbi:MAG: hypothetical protein E7299_02030 [Lachnospiraceae bacterium]|nr:hypothetical protein [Lachnospiraceae bacterium]